MRMQATMIGLLALMISFSAQAQKIGFVSTDYVLSQMPEAKQIQSELQAYERQLTNKIQATVQGYQAQLQQYQQGAATMTEEARAAKEKELTELQQQIQQDQQEAQLNLQRKQGELVQPAFDKIQTAIDKVAADNGYSHIFSQDVAGSPILLFVKNEEEANVSNMVLKQMGITPTPPSQGADSTSGSQE